MSGSGMSDSLDPTGAPAEGDAPPGASCCELAHPITLTELTRASGVRA
jgi:hypothetical protein